MWINASTVKGERARDNASQRIFFTGLCEKETESGRDYFYGEEYAELHHSGGAGGLPRRRSDPRTANRTALHFGALGALQLWHLAHGLEVLEVEFFLH